MTTTMGYLSIVLIYLTIGPSHSSQSLPEARPVQWLFGSPVANDNRYYIEPVRMNKIYDVSTPGPTMTNGFQCRPVKQLTTESKDIPISIVWVYRIDKDTNRQGTYVAAAQTENPTRECFSSIDPHMPNVLRELNEICNTVGFRVLNTSDPSEIEDGTYSGDKDSSIRLEADVKGGRIKRLTASGPAVTKGGEVSYFGVGHVISVTVGKQYTSRDGTLILEPESRALPLQYDAITRRNLGSWDHDESDYEDINEGVSHGEGSGKLWGGLRRMMRRVKRRVVSWECGMMLMLFANNVLNWQLSFFGCVISLMHAGLRVLDDNLAYHLVFGHLIVWDEVV
ncbi:hypothetical protein FOL46_000358 [Perkinsus olseni]|uniref:Uncharacterized protein n=1 Tax=Perkinsus olseni TaxID=32597 RepID=A0A7J6MJA6_PEROL|nr:hypothetical protein FOL46_000358 [Perkinsus olseni]